MPGDTLDNRMTDIPQETTIPAVILVRPQLGENIGKTARAMLNFGLTDLRLVSPRDGWPNPAAGPAAADADQVLTNARVFDTVAEAIADLNHVYAATVRHRDMVKTVVTAEQAAVELHSPDIRGGLMFGPERSGLNNDDVALADTILTIPVNPKFSSLNLAQAVIIAAYEWYCFKNDTVARFDSRILEHATKAQYQGLFDQLEDALSQRGYFRSDDRRPVQMRILKTLLQNGDFTSQEISTLRGVIKSLTWNIRQPTDDE